MKTDGIYITPEYVLDFVKQTATLRYSKETISVPLSVLDYLKKENWRFEKREEKIHKNEISYFAPLKEYPDIDLSETIEDEKTLTPDKKIRQLIEDDDVCFLLDKLTKKQRNVIIETVLNQRGSKYVSSKMKVSEAAVSRLKKNAIDKMKFALEEKERSVSDVLEEKERNGSDFFEEKELEL